MLRNVALCGNGLMQSMNVYNYHFYFTYKDDHSRVKLQQLDDDDPTSDYINANYMPVS